MTENTTWVTIAQAAATSALHPNTIRKLISTGKLPAHRIGSRIVRIKKSDLDALFVRYEGGAFEWNNNR